MATVITTKTFGTTRKVVLKRYGDGMIEFISQAEEPAATTLDSPTVTAFGNTAGILPGMPISGTGIPAGAKVVSVVTNTSITMDVNATATGTPTVTVDMVLGNRKPRFMSNARTKALFDALNAVA